MSKSIKRHGARFRARRRAVDILYEAETRDIDPVAIVEERIELARDPETGVNPVAEYTQTIVSGVAVELDRIDEVVGGHLAEDWAIDRLVPVDRAILRVAVWELLFNEDVPLKTAVAEGVEIAAQLSTDPAPAYVNSVLDAILHKIDALRAETVALAEVEDTTQELSFEQGLAEAEQSLGAAGESETIPQDEERGAAHSDDAVAAGSGADLIHKANEVKEPATETDDPAGGESDPGAGEPQVSVEVRDSDGDSTVTAGDPDGEMDVDVSEVALAEPQEETAPGVAAPEDLAGEARGDSSLDGESL